MPSQAPNIMMRFMQARSPKPPMPTPSQDAAEDRRAVRAWIDEIKTRFHVEVPEIARRAGISAGTIYRWFDDDASFTPSRATLRKIASAFGVEMPGEPSWKPKGFEDAELVAMVGEQIPESLQAAMDQGVWRMTTRALEMVGIMPGDMLLVDMRETPRTGDVVCAQIYDFQRGTAETKLRLFEPPYLLTATMDHGAREAPIYVDGERAAIRGVVVRTLRERRP